MRYIKNSFADCSKCELLESPSCIMETNCKKDLTKVDIIFIAENPGKNEVKQEKLFVGKSGKLFKKYFKKYKIDKMNYLLTNVVMCQTINNNGETENPEKEVIDKCKTNCFNIIDVCKPKLIVLMGTSCMNAFDVCDIGITNKRGKYYKWNFKNIEYNIFLTVHPSFVMRNKETYEPIFENDILVAGNYIDNSLKDKYNMKNTNSIELEMTGIKGKYEYKIPKKFYTKDYRLIDIQYLNFAKEVLYIFRDKDNNKVFHKENDKFVCYKANEGIEARKIVCYDDLEQVIIPYKDRYELDKKCIYEGDVRLTTKHAMDYYTHNEGECLKTHDNIYFYDIEIDTGDVKEFPHPEYAKYPIDMITAAVNDKKICYVLDNKTEPILKDDPTVEYKTFNSEKSMMLKFIRDFKTLDPDYCCGWNSSMFDLPYIYKRLELLGIKQSSLSNFNDVYVDGERGIGKIAGCVVTDQLVLYKMFTFTKQPNYKLGTIGQIEVGETKLNLPLPFNRMYWELLNKTIAYNIRDVDLLVKLEKKLKHVNLLNEIRGVCKTSYESGSSAFGQVDSIVVSYLRDKNLASITSNPGKKEKYPGAFVYAPDPGIYENITDFDFTALYPSEISTFNIGINTYVMKFKNADLGYDIAYNEFEKWPDVFDVVIDPTHKNISSVLTKSEVRDKIKDENLVHTINGCFFKSHEEERSYYALILEGLLETRSAYKKKKFDAVEKKDFDAVDFYHTKQLVYKVLANSMYGIIANKAFRFYDTSCAGAITLSGQESLKNSITYGDAFMEHMRSEKDMVIPDVLTKEEMFGTEMPDRKTKYIVTGDTDSIFCCFQDFKMEKTVENIKAKCDLIQDYLNDEVMIDIVKMHNIDPSFNKLFLKNELIISRGLFLAKKRYCIRVISQESKTVDQVISMGLETKRSDFCSHTKEFLNELLELIMKSDRISLPKILKFVNRKEKEFLSLIKSGDRSIAKPVRYGKKISDYKMIPQGVRGMHLWNCIQNDIHTVGCDGLLFKIQGIDRTKAPKEILEKYDNHIKNDKISKGKAEVIVVPDDEDSLPAWWIIDKKDMMRTTFVDRYNLMLKPLLIKQGKAGVLSI